jgi:hypothetical protein
MLYVFVFDSVPTHICSVLLDLLVKSAHWFFKNFQDLPLFSHVFAVVALSYQKQLLPSSVILSCAFGIYMENT